MQALIGGDCRLTRRTRQWARFKAGESHATIARALRKPVGSICVVVPRTMKAIGASGGQIIVVHLSVAFALGAVATAIAVPLAAVVGRQYATFTADLLNFSVKGVPIPRGAIAAQIAVGLLLPILSAAMPVVLACRVSVSDALRDIGLGGGAGRVVLDVPQWARAEWLPRTMRYAVRNVLRRRQRAVFTVFTLATGGAVYLGAGNLGRSVKGSVDRIYDAQHFQMTLRVAQPALPEALERVVRATPGVSDAESWSGVRAAVARADGSPGSSFAVSAPPVGTRLVRPRMTAGPSTNYSFRHRQCQCQTARPGKSPGAVAPARL